MNDEIIYLQDGDGINRSSTGTIDVLQAVKRATAETELQLSPNRGTHWRRYETNLKN